MTYFASLTGTAWVYGIAIIAVLIALVFILRQLSKPDEIEPGDVGKSPPRNIFGGR